MCLLLGVRFQRHPLFNGACASGLRTGQHPPRGEPPPLAHYIEEDVMVSDAEEAYWAREAAAAHSAEAAQAKALISIAISLAKIAAALSSPARVVQLGEVARRG